MTGDFNIQDSLWDPSFPHHSFINNDLLIIADSFNLNLLVPINQIPTRYSDNINDLNSVIDLMFLQCGLLELNNYSIHPDQYLTFDHAPLTITISIIKENVNSKKRSIIKDSKEKEQFIKDIIVFFKNLKTSNLSDTSNLENTVNEFAKIVDKAWVKNLKIINVTKYSKSWWNEKYSKNLEKYKRLKSLEDWKSFYSMVKSTKQVFFDLKIQEIVNKKQGPQYCSNYQLTANDMLTSAKLLHITLQSVLQQCSTMPPALKAICLSHVYSAVTVQDCASCPNVHMSYMW